MNAPFTSPGTLARSGPVQATTETDASGGGTPSGFDPQRSRDIAAFLHGTPAERDAAAMRMAERAMAKLDTPADDAVRSLLPGLLSDDEMKVVQQGHKAFEGRR